MVYQVGHTEVSPLSPASYTKRTRHAYVLVTASPQLLPECLADIYSGLVVLTIDKPFNLDTLQEIMHAALGRLAVAHH